MRAKVADLVRHPTWIGSWWLDWPARHRHFWRELLLAPGQGWLRWGIAYRTSYYYIDEGLRAPEDYPVAPPLRRAWFSMATVLAWVTNRHNFRKEAPWPGFRSAGYPMWRDEDRHRELWGGEMSARPHEAHTTFLVGLAFGVVIGALGILAFMDCF